MTKSEIMKIYKQAVKGDTKAQAKLQIESAKLGKKANARLRNVEKYGSGQWAANKAKQRNERNYGSTRFRENTKKLSLKQQMVNAINAQEFIENKASTVRGIQRIEKEMLIGLSQVTNERGWTIGHTKTAAERAKWSDFLASDFFKEFVVYDSQGAFTWAEEALFEKGASLEDLEAAYQKYKNKEGDLYSVWENWADINPFEI